MIYSTSDVLFDDTSVRYATAKGLSSCTAASQSSKARTHMHAVPQRCGFASSATRALSKKLLELRYEQKCQLV